jgi:hypothetical protein
MAKGMAALAAIGFVCASALAVGAQRGAEGRGATSRPTNIISGRVVDSSGTPVKGAFVTALRPNTDRAYGFEPVSVQFRSETDEQGNFLLENLASGEYYVLAIPINPDLGRDGKPNVTGFANTFYPSARRIGEARLVRVIPLSRVNADITLVEAKLSSVRGNVFDASGQLVRNGWLAVGRGDGLFGLVSGRASINQDGTFTVRGLQPGTYYLHYREGAWPPPRGVVPKISGATVIASGLDVGDVRVVPIPMVRGIGRVLVDAAARPSLNLSQIRVAGVPVDFSGNPGPQLPGTVSEDSTFAFKTWPSLGRIRIDGLPTGWQVGTIRVNGVEAKTVEFVAGKDVTGIEIELRGPGRVP